MLKWIAANPLDALKVAASIVAVCFAAGVAWAQIDARLDTIETALPALVSDVRETRDMVRELCAVTPACSGASPRP